MSNLKQGLKGYLKVSNISTQVCVVSLLKFEGKLMMVIASKGHFFTQIPQPMQSSSEIEAIFTNGVTSIHNFPIRTTGHDFLHSCRHLLGLHLSLLTIAILVWVSVSSAAFLFNFGGILKQKSCGNCQFWLLPLQYTCFVQGNRFYS